MELKQIKQNIAHEFLQDDSNDELDCFGEFNKYNKVCTKYCSTSIKCVIEKSQNPKIDILEHILNLNFFPARMH